jgi:hypothetical protein
MDRDGKARTLSGMRQGKQSENREHAPFLALKAEPLREGWA